MNKQVEVGDILLKDGFRYEVTVKSSDFPNGIVWVKMNPLNGGIRKPSVKTAQWYVEKHYDLDIQYMRDIRLKGLLDE